MGGNELTRFIAESREHFGVQKVFRRRPNPIEGAPSLLSGDTTLPLLTTDVGVGKHIQRTGKKKAFIEPIIRRTDLNGFREIGVVRSLNLPILGGHAGTKMPFAHISGIVSARLKHGSQSMLGNGELKTDKAPRSALLSFCKTKGITTGHDRGPARYANGIGHVGVGELHAIPAKLIEMRSRNFGLLSTESLNVPISQIIRQNENDVRAIRRKELIENNQEKKNGSSQLHILSVKISLGYGWRFNLKLFTIASLTGEWIGLRSK